MLCLCPLNCHCVSLSLELCVHDLYKCTPGWWLAMYAKTTNGFPSPVDGWMVSFSAAPRPKTFYHHLQGRIGFNTLNPSLSTGKDYPVHSLMMKRMVVLHQNPGVIGKSNPSVLEISLDRLGSQEIYWASGMDFQIPPLF